VSAKTLGYHLRGYGDIPFNQNTDYEDDSPFKIENNCLIFGVKHGGCGYTYDLIWDGKFRKDNNNKTIAEIKFILFYTDYCERLNSNRLKYDLSEIINGNKGENLFLNFIGYDKLIKIK
jgi:hypothetical protein